MSSLHEKVRDHYGRTAQGLSAGAEDTGAPAGSCCCSSTPTNQDESCCGSRGSSIAFGYTIEELKILPEGADLALGCGNPTAIAGIEPGETVVDLGSGGGIDCFLAAARTGESGHVIGVDMTPDMIELARRNARKAGAANVEFRLGEIEHLPIADNTADLIISNCVINLSPDKPQVFREAFRILAPGGRLMVSDVIADGELREDLKTNVRLLTGCIAGAISRDDFLQGLTAAGFEDVHVERETEYLKTEHLAGLAADAGICSDTAAQIAATMRSATIYARKPERD